MTKEEYRCAYCGKIFTAAKSNARFCCKSCCTLWHRMEDERDNYQFRTEIDSATDDIEVYKQYITESEWEELKIVVKRLRSLLSNSDNDDYRITIYLEFWKKQNHWRFGCSWYTGYKFDINPRTISTKVDKDSFLALLGMYRLSRQAKNKQHGSNGDTQ